MNENPNVMLTIVVNNTSVLRRINSGILLAGLLGFWTSTDVSCFFVNIKRRTKPRVWAPLTISPKFYFADNIL